MHCVPLFGDLSTISLRQVFPFLQKLLCRCFRVNVPEHGKKAQLHLGVFAQRGLRVMPTGYQFGNVGKDAHSKEIMY